MTYSASELILLISQGREKEFYNSKQWRKLSKQVIQEGKKECLYCRQQGKIKQAVLTHHFNELKLRPDLAYSRTYTDTDGKEKQNLIPLCYDCHERIHKRGQYQEFKRNENKFWQEERW